MSKIMSSGKGGGVNESSLKNKMATSDHGAMGGARREFPLIPKHLPPDTKTFSQNKNATHKKRVVHTNVRSSSLII